MSDYFDDIAQKAATDAVVTAPTPLRSIDLVDCLTKKQEPVPWLVEPWMADRDVVVLAGEPKTGKSWLAQALAFALARGEPWLGTGAGSAPRRVLYLDEENNPRLVRYRVRKLARGLGIDADELARLPLRYLSQNCLNLDNDGKLGDLWADVEAFRPDFVVLDSLVRFHGRDENSNTALAGFFSDVVKPLTGHYGAGVLILHHLAKPGKDRAAGDLVNRVRGAGDIVAVADQVWTLERRDEGAVLRHERSRWAETASALAVSVTDTEDGEGVTVGGQDADDSARDVIFETLVAAEGEGVLRREIVNAVVGAGFKERVTNNHLKHLRDSKQAVVTTEGKARRYYLWRYAPDDDTKAT